MPYNAKLFKRADSEKPFYLMSTVFLWETSSIVFEYGILPDNDTPVQQMIPGDEVHSLITLQLALWLLIQSMAYCIAGKFGGEKVWQIDLFQTFDERNFGELIDQAVDY